MRVASAARLSLRRPGPPEIEAFRRAQSGRPYSYAAVGATQAGPPRDFTVDHHRVHLGNGPDAYAAACAALRDWRHFRLGWVEVWPRAATIAVGTEVVVVARAGALWTLNACRIVYVVADERRYAYAYGTLPGHIERGEERFMVERDGEDRIWYELLAYSRPQHWLARLGRPLTRHYQRCFARDSLAAMAAACTLTPGR